MRSVVHTDSSQGATSAFDIAMAKRLGRTHKADQHDDIDATGSLVDPFNEQTEQVAATLA